MTQRRPHGSSIQQNSADPGSAWRQKAVTLNQKSKAGPEAEKIRRAIEKKRIEEARARLASEAQKYEEARRVREGTVEAQPAAEKQAQVAPAQRPQAPERAQQAQPQATPAQRPQAQERVQQAQPQVQAPERAQQAQPQVIPARRRPDTARTDRKAPSQRASSQAARKAEEQARPVRERRQAQRAGQTARPQQTESAQRLQDQLTGQEAERSRPVRGSEISAEERQRRVEAQRRRMAAEKRRRLEEEKKAREQESRRQEEQKKTKAKEQKKATPARKKQTKTPEKKAKAQPGTEAPKKKKKVFTKPFVTGFLIAWGVIVILIVVMLLVLSSFLKRFENGLPEHYLDRIVEEFEQGNMDSVHLETADGVAIGDPSLLADKNQIGSFIKTKSEAEPLRYVKVNAESMTDDIVYSIRSGDEKLLKIYISRDPNEKKPEWEEQKTVLDSEELVPTTVTAQIPSACTLSINGQTIDRAFITEPNAEISLLSNLVSRGFLWDMPTLDTYTVQGIFPTKEVSMTDTSGNTFPCSLTGEVYHAGFEVDEAFAQEETAKVLSMFEPYALYFSGDAQKGVLNEIMLVDSPAYQSASAADVSWMQAHDGIDLVNQKVENIRRYSDNCFSCDISFEQNIYQGGEVVRTWDTNMTWILIWQGDYYLADFITKTAED